MTAPYIMLLLIAFADWVGWALRGIKSDGTIAGLNGRIAVFEDRLKLPGERMEALDKAKADLGRR